MINDKMLFFFIPLIVIAGFWMISNKTQNKFDKILLMIIGLMFIFLFIEFSFLGSDYGQYIRNFSKYKKRNWYEIFKMLRFINEPLFILYIKSISIFFETSKGFFYITAILITVLNMVVIRRMTGNIYERLILFVITGIWWYSLNAIRQSIVIPICYLGILFFQSKRYRDFIILAIFASLIHTSAILFFIFYLIITSIGKKVKNLHYIILVLLASLIIGNSNILLKIFGFLSGSPLVYDTYMFRKISIVRVIFFQWPALVYIYGIYRGKVIPEFFLFYSVYALCFMNSPYFYRLLPYFDFFLIAELPSILSDLDKPKLKIWMYIALGTFSLLSM